MVPCRPRQDQMRKRYVHLALIARDAARASGQTRPSRKRGATPLSSPPPALKAICSPSAIHAQDRGKVRQEFLAKFHESAVGLDRGTGINTAELGGARRLPEPGLKVPDRRRRTARCARDGRGADRGTPGRSGSIGSCSSRFLARPQGQPNRCARDGRGPTAGVLARSAWDGRCVPKFSKKRLNRRDWRARATRRRRPGK